MIEVGTIVDNRYRIQSVLGTGAFGTVYQAWQVQFDRVVALKTLNTKVLDEADGLARFEREARAISAIKHKNTIAFYGFGVWDHAPYMVMEFVEGINLESVLKEEARRILKDLSQQPIILDAVAVNCWYQLAEAEYLLGNYNTAREHFARSIEYAQLSTLKARLRAN